MTSRKKRKSPPQKSEIVESPPVKNLLFHRLMLVIMAFLAGAAVMVMELSTILLFALPGFFLGSVSPYIIRLVSLLSADKHIGLSAGTVYMFSTIGSVLGTFAAGFWLISSLDLEQVFWFTGGAIALLACLGYVLSLQKRAFVALHILVLAGAVPVLVGAASRARPSPDARLA